MEYGAHLPLISFVGERRSLTDLLDFTGEAESLGYTFLCANDHLVFSRPWLDGPTALAAVLERSGSMRLATTVSIPVVRGPALTAKVLGAIDLLSGGRLVAGVGPGSSASDYELVGIPFEERWKRLEEVVQALRAYWGADAPRFEGTFYSTAEQLEPYPSQQPAPPIWIGSWGSKVGLRRTARLGDGWLASGYNTTPEVFGKAWQDLKRLLPAAGKDAETFPNAIATMWMYVTEDREKSGRVLGDVLAPMLGRPVEELEERLPVGTPEHCARVLAAYAKAGAQRVFLWPVADELVQLGVFREQVVPLVEEMELE